MRFNKKDVKRDNEKYSCGIMATLLMIIFVGVIFKFSDAEVVCNIILTDDAIYSKELVVIADPEPEGWCRIVRNGETYIQYGFTWGYNPSYAIYDLNGNLVESG